MTFQEVTPSVLDFMLMGPGSPLLEWGDTELIIGNGQIVENNEIPGVDSTSATLEGFLKSHNTSAGTLLVLSSLGGSLSEGLLTGDIVRKHGLRTSIVPGSVCASACNFIFMGGTARSIPETSAFVVHRFAPGESGQVDSKQASEHAQLNSGIISSFLAEMGIGPNFLFLMSTIENSKPKTIPIDTLKELRVLSSGGVTAWKMYSKYSSFILESTTTKNDNVGSPDYLSLVCGRGKLSLRVFYNPRKADYVRPPGAPTENPDEGTFELPPDQGTFELPQGGSRDHPLVQQLSRELWWKYPLWAGTAQGLADMTYGFGMRDFSDTVDMRVGGNIVAGSNYIGVHIPLTPEMIDLLQGADSLWFEFLISRDGRVPNDFDDSGKKHHANPRAEVGFLTKFGDEREELHSFIQGCGEPQQ